MRKNRQKESKKPPNKKADHSTEDIIIMQNRKSKQSSFPHPVIRTPGQVKMHRPIDDNCRIPYTYQPFQTEKGDRPCPHIIRPSYHTLGQTPDLNSFFQVGLVAQPFGWCCYDVQQISQAVKCQYCQVPIISISNKESADKGYCRICNKDVPLTAEEVCRLQQQLTQPVIDSIESKIEQSPERYIFAIEVSQFMLESDQLHLIRSSVEHLIEQGRKCEVGFVLLGERIAVVGYSSLSDEPMLHIITDTSQDLPLPTLYLSVDSQGDKIRAVLDVIVEYGESTFNKSKSLFSECMEFIVRICSNARLLVFTALLASVKSQPQGKSEVDQKIEKLSRRFFQNKLPVYLFVFESNSSELISNIACLSYDTGGTIEYYRRNTSKTFSCRELYYDIHRVIHSLHLSDIDVKILTTRNLKLTSTILTHQKVELGEFKLISFSPQSTLTVNLKPIGTLKYAPSVCILICYSEANIRKQRCIQYTFGVSSNLTEVLGGISDQGVFYTLCRGLLANLQDTPKLRLEKATNSIKKILQKSKQASLSSQTPSIPASLKLTCFYMAEMLKSGLFGGYADIRPNESYMRTYKFCSAGLQTLSKQLYMKLYRIDNDRQYEVGEYPKNIKLQSHRVELQGLYLLDNGKMLYVLVGEDVSKVKLNNILGILRIQEIDELQEIPVTNNPMNTKLIQTIEMLRSLNRNHYLQLKGVREGSQQYYQLMAWAFYREDQHKRLLAKLVAF